MVSVTSETFDHNPKNNDDVEIVNVTENNKTPKNDTNETHKFNKKHSNDVNVDKPLSLLESNVTGNPFLFSVIYALIVLILMGGCYSKKR